MTTLPPDYPERVYAGVLGKIIGVYLGRPIEGWTADRISRELGEIDYYVNGRLDPATYDTELVVADDDISGTFIFPRALGDPGSQSGAGSRHPPRLTSEQIGNAWLNHIVEGRTMLWWGGIGTATEHTAYWRLKNGIAAPRSGSAGLNGPVLAEQIGGQIFIDGWALASPGDPQQAAWLAERAARVSHDGVAVDAARLIAAMEAQAFVETDIDRLLDTGLRCVLPASALRRMIGDIREWHAAAAGEDWRSARRRVAAQYGYDRYGGACHVMPNHALIILALLYGSGDFQRSLSIVCGSGWDTDCNAGNLGCLLGIRGGLAAIDAGPDWRGPVADRMYLPGAEGGGAVTDAVIEAQSLARAGYALAGATPPPADKQGARFNFAFPGSTQGFTQEASEGVPAGTVTLENVPGRSAEGARSLAIRLNGLAPGAVARVGTATFFTPHDLNVPGYRLMGCPTLYSGQMLQMRVQADPANSAALVVRPYCACFGGNDRMEYLAGPTCALPAGAEVPIAWRVPETGGRPICRVGLELETRTAHPAEACVYLDYVRWNGAPDTVLRRPSEPGRMWRHAWVDAADQFSDRWEAFRISHGSGLGMLIQGTRDWRDYQVSAEIIPHLAKSWGLAARVGGLRRYFAIIFDNVGGKSTAGGDRVSIRKSRGEVAILATAAFPWKAEQAVLREAIGAWPCDRRLGGRTAAVPGAGHGPGACLRWYRTALRGWRHIHGRGRDHAAPLTGAADNGRTIWIIGAIGAITRTDAPQGARA